MKCPLVWYQDYDKGVPSGFRYGDCLKEECAWWNDYYGKCSISVDAFLKGIADHRLEVKQAMKDRY